MRRIFSGCLRHAMFFGGKGVFVVATRGSERPVYALCAYF